MHIAVDIDGILTIETEGHDFEKRTPNLHNIDFVNKLYNKGHTITLWTSRYYRDRRITKKWLKKYGVQYDHLKMRKSQFDLFIDDKTANSFSSDNPILTQLLK